MSSEFDVELSPVPGALQRLLGVVRRRGFTILSLSAVRDDTGDGYRVAITVSGARRALTLRNHLANLVDVRSVNLLSCTQASCA